MPDYAHDAARMLRTISTKMGRDPAKTKQTWYFSWTAKNALTEERVNTFAQPIVVQIMQTYKLWLLPDFEVHFDRDFSGWLSPSALLLSRGATACDSLGFQPKENQYN